MLIDFLYPLGFLAAIGIAIPVLIHLWRKEKLKVLRVGSIKLLENTKKQRINRLYIKNWPLLLARCLLIIIWSLLLAAPYVDFNKPSTQEAGWILLGSGYQGSLGQEQWQAIDSLVTVGYTIRAFEPGFRKIDSNVVDTVAAQSNQFALIHQLNETVPNGFPVTIFSLPRVSEMTGEIPATRLEINWHAFNRFGESANTTWVTRAWKTATGELTVIQGFSNPNKTHFEQLIWKENNQQGIQVSMDNEHTRVKSADQPNWVIVDDQPYRIQFATDGPLADEQYFNALISAFQQTTQRQVAVSKYLPSDSCDLLIDLSTQGVTNNAKTIFRYVDGDPEKQHDNYLIEPGLTASRDKATIFQLVVANTRGTPIWSDVKGRPLLTVMHSGDTAIFHCYIRFNPKWTDLVWSNAFINQVVPLILPVANSPIIDIADSPNMDQRALTSTIRLPKQDSIVGHDVLDTKQPNTTTILAWLALFILFIERLMTYGIRARRRVIHG